MDPAVFLFLIQWFYLLEPDGVLHHLQRAMHGWIIFRWNIWHSTSLPITSIISTLSTVIIGSIYLIQMACPITFNVLWLDSIPISQIRYFQSLCLFQSPSHFNYPTCFNLLFDLASHATHHTNLSLHIFEDEPTHVGVQTRNNDRMELGE
eukprot:151347_1